SDTTTRLWQTSTGQHHTTLKGHTGPVSGVAFSPDGTLLATASSDTTTRLWQTSTGQHHTTLEGHTNWVNGVAFSPDGTLLATASDDNTARLWEVATGTCLAVLLPLPSGYAVLLPDGSYKLDGEPGNVLWWALKLCRFAPGELDEYVPGLVRRPADSPIRPAQLQRG
ncbi:MAG TPA: hypothetical protein VFB84_12700, partial [Micromonosporaceae bacterium]|nr:hypothetical protein [Micromonosporaceae bacterium]